MEQRRFVHFITFALGMLLLWQFVIQPRLAPPAAPDLPKKTTKPAPGKDAPKVVVVREATRAKPALVKLGSLDPKSGYRMLVVIDSHGAAVKTITLNDPRYPDESDHKLPLTVVGHENTDPLTYGTSLKTADGKDVLPGHAERQYWEIVPGSQSESGVTFRYADEHGLEMRKKYTLAKIEPHPLNEKPAYELGLEFTVRNTTDEARQLRYVLTGPCSLPLENKLYTHKFRDVIGKFIQDNGTETAQHKTAAEVADQTELWNKPLKYIGIDTQYFAGLVSPVQDQVKDRTVDHVTQGRIKVNNQEAEKKEWTNTTVLLTSVMLDVPPGKDVTHGYKLFAGPKRDDLVDGDVLTYGWFGVVSRLLLAVLHFFHGIFGNYGIAIICLTITVRLCILPLSIKQSRAMARMQALQPEINALKAKYGENEKEKLGAATMELYSKHGVNPFGGCLLVLPQLPIFMGLYQALSNSVDLRMQQFLWIQNLAAPEKLFEFPMHIWFIGQHFNLLPFFTVGLFLVQQKLFTPPAVDEQGRQQQVIMNIMTVVMGVMFYQVASGLCIYFITSSLWGIGERLLLGKMPKPTLPSPQEDRGGGGGRRDEDKPRAPTGFWGKMLEAAEKERSIRNEKSKNR